mgnify:FL=1
MVDQNCAYCVEGDLVAKFGIKICELETSKVYLFKEQSHPGRCIVAHKKHVGDMNELTAEERAAYFEDVARVARAIMLLSTQIRLTMVHMVIQVIIFISISALSIRTSSNGVAYSL